MPANRKTNDSILLTRPSVQFCPLIFIFLNPSNKLTYFKDARQLRHGHFGSTMERKHKHISPEQITSSGTSSEEQAVEEVCQAVIPWPRGNPEAYADSISGPQRFGAPLVGVMTSTRLTIATRATHQKRGRDLCVAADDAAAHQVPPVGRSLLCLPIVFVNKTPFILFPTIASQ